MALHIPVAGFLVQVVEQAGNQIVEAVVRLAQALQEQQNDPLQDHMDQHHQGVGQIEGPEGQIQVAQQTRHMVGKLLQQHTQLFQAPSCQLFSCPEGKSFQKLGQLPENQGGQVIDLCQQTHDNQGIDQGENGHQELLAPVLALQIGPGITEHQQKEGGQHQKHLPQLNQELNHRDPPF